METSSMWTDAPSPDLSVSLLSADGSAEGCQLAGLEPGGLVTPDLNLLARKLGGLRNIGWTVERRIENGHVFYQALVYSLRTFQTFPSPWLSSENEAIRSALLQCCTVEVADGVRDSTECLVEEGRESGKLLEGKKEGRGAGAADVEKNGFRLASQHFPEGDLVEFTQPSHGVEAGTDSPFSRTPEDGVTDNQPFLDPQRRPQRVVVWASYVPEDGKKAIGLYRDLLSTASKLLLLLRLPISSQGLLIFGDLPSAVDFLRNAKSQQLEFFDSFVAGSWSSRTEGLCYVLFDGNTKDCIGFSLVNVSSNHPLCVHTLLRLSQHDTVALGHKRSSTETLRLLFTHPEVTPSVVSPQMTAETFNMSRSTPLSQTPSHRRALIWCALCNIQARDIPGAWKHVSKPPHETIRNSQNGWIMAWLMTNYPVLFGELMDASTNECLKGCQGRVHGGKSSELKALELNPPSQAFDHNARNSVQYNLLGRTQVGSSHMRITPPGTKGHGLTGTQDGYGNSEPVPILVSSTGIGTSNSAVLGDHNSRPGLPHPKQSLPGHSHPDSQLEQPRLQSNLPGWDIGRRSGTTGATPLNPNASPFIPTSNSQQLSERQRLLVAHQRETPSMRAQQEGLKLDSNISGTESSLRSQQRLVLFDTGDLSAVTSVRSMEIGQPIYGDSEEDRPINGSLGQLGEYRGGGGAGETGLASEARFLMEWLWNQGLSPRHESPHPSAAAGGPPGRRADDFLQSMQPIGEDSQELPHAPDGLFDYSTQRQRKTTPQFAVYSSPLEHSLGHSLGHPLAHPLGHPTW